MHNLINFKNIADSHIDLFSPVNILIGRNGSGKTNVIEGIELLANLAQGVPLHEITDIKGSGKYEVRGGLPSCIGFGKRDFALVFSHDTIRFGGKNNAPLFYGITISTSSSAKTYISKERLIIGERTFFDAKHSPSGLLEVTFDNFAQGGNNPTHNMSAERSVLSRYDELIATSAASNSKRKQAPVTVNNIKRYLEKAYIFDLQPKAMRDYNRIGLNTLLRNGGNLSSVLYNLFQTDNKTLEKINPIIRQLPEEPFANIDFVTTALNDVLLSFRLGNGNSSNGKLIDARLLSDGTLRMLGVLTALETVPEGSRIVIEEFDNGLHPSRAKLLTKTLFECAERRKLNVLVTTHNPALLNALEDKHMGNVVLCYRHEDGGTKLIKISDLPDADILPLQGGLGDLITREVLDKYLSEERKAAMKEWLKSLP